jgi:hypothetical protein
MSNIFNAFLGGVLDSAQGDMRDYAHANRLYVQNNYARAPKHGFLYFVHFNINRAALQKTSWAQNGPTDVGLLVKKVDQPKFTIATDTINQYNRKTVVQTQIKYNPVSIDFHDDNGDMTRDLWKNYYQYYFRDTFYNPANNRTVSNAAVAGAFSNKSKYGTKDYAYGLNNFQIDPFFQSIDIFVLHQKKFSQYTLVNPLVTEWNHDSLDQEQSNKILTNRMTVSYEAVYYNQGKIKKGSASSEFTAVYYDNSPSPLSISGKGSSSLFGPGGLINGADSIFGEDGSLENAQSPLDYLKVAVQTNNLIKNAGQLTKAGLVSEVNNVTANLLTGISATGRGPTGVAGAVNDTLNATTALPSRVTGR